jgi:hypothetical protein
MLSSSLPIALDGTLRACLTTPSQVSSQDTPKNTSEYPRKYTSNYPCKYTSKYPRKYTSESLARILSRGKTVPISLDYMLPCTLLNAQCRDFLSSRSQPPGGVRQVAYGGQCLAGGMWHQVCGRWRVAYGVRNHDVGRHHSLNSIFSAPTVTRSHAASSSWC